MLGRNRLLADANPLYHFMELIRAPLLGEHVAALSWIVSSIMMVAGTTLALFMFARFRSRIPYWI